MDIQQLEPLVQAIIPHSKLLQSWQLKGGISAEMTALELQTPAGQTERMIIRRPGDTTLQQNPNAAADEFKLLQITHTLGLATPRPYYLGRSGEKPYLVIEYIEGLPEFSPAHSDDFTLQLATHLAKIHQVNGAIADLSFLPRQNKQLDGRQPTDLNHLLDEGRIRDTLKSIWPLAPLNPPALLHGDYWPGNVLWCDGQLAAVIDWEDASLGDPLIDLAISRLDIAWIFSIQAMNAFTHHYQSQMPIDYTHLPHWDLWAALRLIRLAGSDLAAWAAFFPPFGRPDITEQTIRENYKIFITQAFAKLADS